LVNHGLSFKYDPKARCEKFESYLNTICEGFEDRKTFLKSSTWALLHGKNDEFYWSAKILVLGDTSLTISGLDGAAERVEFFLSIVLNN
jgi:hypothetical protein